MIPNGQNWRIVDQATHNKIVFIIWGIADYVLRDFSRTSSVPPRFRHTCHPGAYLRRPPLAEYRLLPSGEHEVRFLTKDKKLGRTVTTVYPVREFIARLADQVPDRYRHGIRYFDLLAPQSIGKSDEVFLALLGQKREPRPRRIRWAASIRWTFQRDPLLDSDGRRMYWAGRISPVKREAT
jgi:hypothetical protein